MVLRTLFRIVAIVAAPFALFQFFGPLADFFDWLRTAVDPSISHVQPTAFEHFAASSLRMVYGTMLLAVPLLLWLAGECSAKLASRGVRAAE